jgi:phenylalanyl-tRNA synthetase beta chain
MRAGGGKQTLGVLGELHPSLRRSYDLPEAPVVAADLDLEALLGLVPARHDVAPTPAFPPVLEDLAIVVEDAVPAERVEAVVRQAGGELLSEVHLFDLYRGRDRLGQEPLCAHLPGADRTLTDRLRAAQGVARWRRSSARLRA